MEQNNQKFSFTPVKIGRDKPYAYIDVDLTLVDLDGVIMEGVADRLPALYTKYNLVCWSAGGGDYAYEMCRRNKIDEYFITFLDKPYIIIDDDPDHILSCRKVLILGKDSWTEETFWSKIFGKMVTPWIKTSDQK